MSRLEKLNQAGTALLTLALALVGANGFLAYRAFQAVDRTAVQVERTQRIESASMRLLSALLDAEAGQRGFLLTGSETYLQPYHRAVTEVPAQLAVVEALLDKSDSQVAARLGRLRPLINEKLQELAQTVELRRTSGGPAANAVVLSERGRVVMDQIRENMNELAAESGRQSTSLAEESSRYSQTLELLTTVGSLILFLILAASALALRRASARRDEMIEKYRSLTENSPDAIFRVDAETRYSFVNATCLQASGHSERDFLGKRINELFPGEAGEQLARAARLAVETKKRQEEECPSPLTADGFWDIRAIPELDAKGTVPSALVIATDISVRKRHELALRESEAELRRLSIALITAQEDTARRIARELHDDIAQRLAFLSMEIGKASAAPPSPEDLPAALKLYQNKVKEVSEGIRRISHQMHPSILDDLGLSPALEALCYDLEHSSGIRVHFDAHQVPDDVDRTVASCLYRLGQESLRNIAKHARATEVTMLLSAQEQTLQLVVVDDGVGFEAATRKPGLGTISMRERVRLVNGDVSVESAPGMGTRITARIPMVLPSG